MAILKNKNLYIAALAILFLAGAFFFFGKEENLPNTTSEKSSNLFTVEVRKISSEPFQPFFIFPGTTKAYKTLDLASRMAGYITALPQKKGITLPKGTVVAKLDTESLPYEQKKLVKRIAYLNQKQETEKKLRKKGLSSLAHRLSIEADLAQAQADLISVNIRLKKAIISTPFSGALQKVFVEVGSFIKEGDPIAYMIDLRKIKVLLQIPEHLWKSFHQVEKASLILPNGKEQEGDITYMSQSANPKTHTYDIELTLNNKEFLIPEGLSVQGKFYMKSLSASKISHQALTLNDEGTLGIKCVVDNKVVFYPVDILKDESQFLWVKGLPHDSMIIINGQEYVTNNQKVLTKIKN